MKPAWLALLLFAGADGALAQDAAQESTPGGDAVLQEIEAQRAALRAELERLRQALADSDARIEASHERIRALQQPAPAPSQ